MCNSVFSNDFLRLTNYFICRKLSEKAEGTRNKPPAKQGQAKNKAKMQRKSAQAKQQNKTTAKKRKKTKKIPS